MQKVAGDTTSMENRVIQSYPKDISQLAIGIYNTGTYGDYLLETMLTCDQFSNIDASSKIDRVADFAGEYFEYLNLANDTYTGKGNDMLRDDIVKNCLFLMDVNYYDNVKSASKIIIVSGPKGNSQNLKDTRNLLSLTDSQVKLLGTIESTVKSVLDRYIDNDKAPVTIGIIAHSNTITTSAYEEEFAAALKQRGIKSDRLNLVTQSIMFDDVMQLPMLDAAMISLIEKHHSSNKTTPLTAIIVEERIGDKEIDSFNKIIDNFRSMRRAGNYPFKQIISKEITFIEPAQCVARDCYITLRESDNLALRISEEIINSYSSLPQ
jgi:hypothetical protein